MATSKAQSPLRAKYYAAKAFIGRVLLRWPAFIAAYPLAALALSVTVALGFGGLSGVAWQRMSSSGDGGSFVPRHDVRAERFDALATMRENIVTCVTLESRLDCSRRD